MSKKVSVLLPWAIVFASILLVLAYFMYISWFSFVATMNDARLISAKKAIVSYEKAKGTLPDMRDGKSLAESLSTRPTDSTEFLTDVRNNSHFFTNPQFSYKRREALNPDAPLLWYHLRGSTFYLTVDGHLRHKPM